MSLLSEKPIERLRGAADIELLHKLECSACPLNTIQIGGKIKPTGASSPLVYILGEAAGRNEAREREQFIGDSGQLLRANIPRKYRDHVRFNNVIRSHPPGNRTPTLTEIECCRPSVVRDIEQSKPKAIFGFGNVPLEWAGAAGFGGVTLWRGRKMPIKVGKHSCWFFPMLPPAYVIRGKQDSEEERMFRFDLQRAFDELDRLPPARVHTVADVRSGVEIITEGGSTGVQRVREALSWAINQPVIGVDYETNGVRPYGASKKILTAAVATRERAIAFPINHREAPWSPEERELVLTAWKKFLWYARGVKVVHNLAFELEWSGVKLGPDFVRAGRWGDSATQAAVIDERRGKKRPGPFSLEFLVQQYFGFNLKQLAGLDRSKLDEYPVEAVLQYNAPDAKYHALLFEAQREVLEAEGLMEPYELSLRTVPTVVLTQMKGLPVDQKAVAQFQTKYGKKLTEVEKAIFALPVVKEFKRLRRADFNPMSNPDVLYVFKDMLKRSEVQVEDKYTKELKYSADVKILEQIDHPLAKLLIDLRQFNKRKSTYVDPLEEGGAESLIHEDGLLHAQFNTFFAETSRLSCDSPNLQNFPKRDEEAKEVRKQIVAPPGCLALAMDYGQIEARVIAMFTKDKRFVKALWERHDVHMEWAERLAYAYPTRVGGKKMLSDKKAMKTFRTDVKNQWTFPLFFGAKLESAAGYLKMPVDVVRPLYKEFWREFSGVKEWQETLNAFYEEHGYVECLTKRRRRGPLSLNQILNSPVQGTAAGIVLDAMSRLSETGDPELQPEINIHDDLTFMRVPEKRVDDIAERVISAMLKVPFDWVNVPITVEMSVGPNWLEMEECDTFSSDEWS